MRLRGARRGCLALLLLFASPLASADPTGAEYLSDAKRLFSEGAYFRSARYAFAAAEADSSLEPEAHSWAAVSLARAGLANSAAYFFLRTLQSRNPQAIRRALTVTERLLDRVGADTLRTALTRYTTPADYDSENRSAFLFAVAKESLLRGEEEKVLQAVAGISVQSVFYPHGLQLRGVALALRAQQGGANSGLNERAIQDFRACQERSGDLLSRSEGEDLRSRCIAGEARTLYQMDRFQDADRVFDRIPKASMVWPDILFEQAWNAFGRSEYNRTLGKLVSYKSPALSFVFNTEVDVLRAQSYLALCLYADANQVINEFNQSFAKVGEEVKTFVEKTGDRMDLFFEVGKRAAKSSLAGSSSRGDGVIRMANRFVRSPYFRSFVSMEENLAAERQMIAVFDRSTPELRQKSGQGFPGFLDQVLAWRLRSVRWLGGAFVKNSLMDYHSTLLADFDKMAFIKLEMLGKAKDALMGAASGGSSKDERSRGNQRPSRRDDQFFWSFNGEFWNDELGDYVFGLESACRS